jgi:hypothetical protein
MDEGFRGKNQFVFAIQSSEVGNMCAEHDGAPSSNVTSEPKTYAVTYNATYLGSGKASSNADQERIFRIRENWGGEYNNSIFGDYNGYGLDIEDKYSPNDSKDRLMAGQIHFLNNIWFDVNGYTLADSIGRKDYVRDYLTDGANGNTEVDPQLTGISRSQDGGLDPRPAFDGSAFQNLAEYPVTSIEDIRYNQQIPNNYSLEQNYPNPFNPITTISFRLPQASEVRLTIYNMAGQKIATLAQGFKRAGTYNYTWNANDLASGMYIYRLRAGNTVISKKMILLK